MRADEDTLQQIRAVLAVAMGAGKDAAEELDRAGLVRYPDQALRLRKATLHAVAGVLDEMQCNQVGIALGERKALSPLDMKRQIVAWLRQTAEPRQ